MARPKGSKNKPKVEPVKYTEFDKVKLRPSADPGLYTARRVYWLVLNLSKKIQRDPTSVKVADYLELLEKWEALQKNRNKRRDDVGQRVDAGNLAQNRGQDDPASMGGEIPFSMGS